MSHKTHNWRLADDQENAGTMGIRLVCGEGILAHYETVHRDLLESYL